MFFFTGVSYELLLRYDLGEFLVDIDLGEFLVDIDLGEFLVDIDLVVSCIAVWTACFYWAKYRWYGL
jgi:hypothetical protein